MKICILSMHNVPNYGSILQGLSLQRILTSLGHEVKFIEIEENDNDKALLNTSDYVFKDENASSSNLVQKIINNADRYLINKILHRKGIKNLYAMYDIIRPKLLHVDPMNQNEKFDLCVIGSDEVFNCLQDVKWGFTSQLYGNVRQTDKVITYAASCGSTEFKNVPENVRERIKEAFSKIIAFSVRDENTAEFVNAFETGKELYYNLDPVVIGNFDNDIEKYGKLPELPQKYCLIYSYYERFHNKDEIRAIQDFCDKKGLVPIAVGMPQKWIKRFLPLQPFSLLNTFKHSDFVITDTFHGTIFSAKYAKRFAVVIRKSNHNKLSDLTKRLMIENHKVNDYIDLEHIYNVSNNYESIKRIETEGYAKTKAYFEKYLCD